MFNEQIKKEYLLSIANPTTCEQRKNVFHVLEKYEAFIDTDLNAFTADDLLELFEKLAVSGESYDSLIRKRAAINDYRNWCHEHKGTQAAAVSIDSKTISAIIDKNNQYFTEAEILKLAEDLENACDKFLLLAPFYGIGARDKEELLRLSADNFDPGQNTVTLYNGRSLNVSGCLCRLGIQSAETYERINRKDKRRFVLHGETVIKTVKEDASASRFLLKRRMDDISLALDRTITFHKVVTSGILHYTKLSLAVSHVGRISEIFSGEFFEQNVLNRYDMNLTERTFMQKFGVLI